MKAVLIDTLKELDFNHKSKICCKTPAANNEPTEKTTIKTILTGRREKLIQEQIKQVKKQSSGIEIINGGK